MPDLGNRDIRVLSHLFGDNAKAKGFREEGDRLREELAHAKGYGTETEQKNAEQAYANYAMKRIGLINEEVVEAQGEIRHGHATDETYYEEFGKILGPDDARMWVEDYPGEDPWKPEGVPSELADILIRTLELCDEFELDPVAIVTEKYTYNTTRSRMHGGKKF
jgi:hypothetical protein